MNKTLLATALAAALSLGTLGVQADSSSFEGATKDAWITGKVETAFALNSHLNPFEIDTDTQAGVVQLSGAVDSEIDRELAEEVARGVDGVLKVENLLEIDEVRAGAAQQERAEGRRDFGSFVDDAMTTATIKSKLIGSANTSGLKIDVDTEDDVVTLTGRVGSAEESQLAEQIARNTGDVKEVRNHLIVDPS